MIESQSKVVEDWNTGYKIEAQFTNTGKVKYKSWSVDLDLGDGYSIRETYGAEIVNLGNGKYNISGIEGAVLEPGETIKPILIVDDGGQSAITPTFSVAGETQLETKPKSENEESFLEEADDINGNEQETVKLESSMVEDAKIDRLQSDINTTPETTSTNNNTLDVDRDFDGNLIKAITSANQDDTIKMGSGSTYKTWGFTIDKNLTFEGNNSTIDGQGTDDSIIKLTKNADNTNISNLKITNGNNGITGDGASNVTLENLNINNIGLGTTKTEGDNNTGIGLSHADGLKLRNSTIKNIGRKGVGIGDTNNAVIQDLSITNINLEAKHSQSHDAAGIKLFNTDDVKIADNSLSKINANFIWNDTSNKSSITNNTTKHVGEDFLSPSFNSEVDINGIYNEKSSNSVVTGNNGTSTSDFAVFNSTEFSTESLSHNNNSFTTEELNSTDYWTNSTSEKLIALTEDPESANFELIADSYYAEANIG